MTNRQFRILMVLTLVSGFLGGAASNLLLRGAPAVAQAEGTVHEVVKAREFQLVDSDGKLRAALTVSPLGDATFSLYDPAGKGRAALVVFSDGGASLSLHGPAGEGRVWLKMFDGRPRLTILDAEGNVRTVVGCTETVDKHTGAEIDYPESTVTIYKADGDVLWQAP